MKKSDMTPEGIASRTYQLIMADLETLEECNSPSIILNISEQLGRYKKALARVDMDLSYWDYSRLTYSIDKLEQKLNEVK
jgi:hypothetical protein